MFTMYKKENQRHKLFQSKIEALQVMTWKTHFQNSAFMVNIFFEKVNTTVMYTEIGCPFMKSAPFLRVDPFTSQTSH